jgi:hypothetical protein
MALRQEDTAMPDHRETGRLQIVLVALAAATCFAVDAAQGQHRAAPGQDHAPAVAGPQGPFAVRSFGAFRAMIAAQDYRPKVALGDVKEDGATEAVGAVADLRGEITMIDGRFVVSYGAGCGDCPPPHRERATLLASGRVAEWAEPVALPGDLSGKALEAFIVGQARAAGLDLHKPFPLRLKGTLTDAVMHVLAAPNPGFTGHGSAHPMARQDEIKAAAIAGEVVGFYAPPSLAGVITHPGDAFHLHWVDETRSRTAHIDSFGMAKGALLSLPSR